MVRITVYFSIELSGTLMLLLIVHTKFSDLSDQHIITKISTRNSNNVLIINM